MAKGHALNRFRWHPQQPEGTAQFFPKPLNMTINMCTAFAGRAAHGEKHFTPTHNIQIHLRHEPGSKTKRVLSARASARSAESCRSYQLGQTKRTEVEANHSCQAQIPSGAHPVWTKYEKPSEEANWI